MKLLDAKLYDKEGITRSSNPTNRSSRLRFKTMLCSHATGVVRIGRKNGYSRTVQFGCK